MKKTDSGYYNANQEEYDALIQHLYATHDRLSLSEEYSSFVKNSGMNFIIRLARYKFVLRLLKSNDKVLEVGCGSGVGTAILGQFCNSIHGIDVKENEILDARQLPSPSNVTYEQIDFFDYSAIEKFDVILSLDVIEHLKDTERQKFIEKCRMLLNINGMLIIGTPSFYSVPYQSSFSKASHFFCYKREELESDLTKIFGRTLHFSMNDEVVHTGDPRMAWYYFAIATGFQNNG